MTTKKLDDKVIILSAFFLAEAEQLFFENTDIAAIVIDGCVDNDEDLDTAGLVIKIRQTFACPIIAASSYWEF